MPAYDRNHVMKVCLGQGAIPLFSHSNAETAISMVEALYRGGMRSIEFTNRTSSALDVFGAIVAASPSRYPDMILGVGTVLNRDQAKQFVAAGASFIVSPFLDEDLGLWCATNHVFWCPGIGTVTEAIKAYTLGACMVKVFPAEVLGPSFIKAVAAPCPWISMMPSGGVTLDSSVLATWFEAGAACVAVGSALFATPIGAVGLPELEQRTVTLLSTITSIRSRLSAG